MSSLLHNLANLFLGTVMFKVLTAKPVRHNNNIPNTLYKPCLWKMFILRDVLLTSVLMMSPCGSVGWRDANTLSVLKWSKLQKTSRPMFPVCLWCATSNKTKKEKAENTFLQLFLVDSPGTYLRLMWVSMTSLCLHRAADVWGFLSE